MSEKLVVNPNIQDNFPHSVAYEAIQEKTLR